MADMVDWDDFVEVLRVLIETVDFHCLLWSLRHRFFDVLLVQNKVIFVF